MNQKNKEVLARIKYLENGIIKCRQYLDTGKHANWSGFRPVFHSKARNGKELPPHKDWVKNVLLRRYEKALTHAEKTLEKLRHPDKRRKIAKHQQSEISNFKS